MRESHRKSGPACQNKDIKIKKNSFKRLVMEARQRCILERACDAIDPASIENRKMLVRGLIKRADVYRDCKLRIGFEQFSTGPDVVLGCGTKILIFGRK